MKAKPKKRKAGNRGGKAAQRNPRKADLEGVRGLSRVRLLSEAEREREKDLVIPGSETSLKVSVDRVGEMIEITCNGIVWKVQVTLTPTAVTFTDTATGAILQQVEPKSIGLRYQGGKWNPSGREQDALLAAASIAWISLVPRDQ